MAQARRDRLCLLERQLERAQPRAPLDAEQIRHRRAPDQPPHEHGVDLVLRARACAHQLRAPRQAAGATRASTASGDHTASSSPAANSRASVRASSRSVFARAWRIPVSAGLTTTTRATCGSRIRAISHALPVTSNATRSLGARLCANSSSRSGVVAIRPAERTAPPSQIATSQKSRCTSNPIALPTAPTSPSSLVNEWRTSGRTTTTDACSRHIRASRRGGHRNSPSSKLIVQNGLPNRVLRESPCPGRPTVRPGPDSNPQRRSFMPRNSEAPRARPRPARCIGRFITGINVSGMSALALPFACQEQRAAPRPSCCSCTKRHRDRSVESHGGCRTNGGAVRAV